MGWFERIKEEIATWLVLYGRQTGLALIGSNVVWDMYNVIMGRGFWEPKIAGLGYLIYILGFVICLITEAVDR